MIARVLLLAALMLASLPAFASGVMVYFTAPTQTTFTPPATFTVSVQADAWDGYEYVSSLKLYRNGALIASKTGSQPGTIGVSAGNSSLPTGRYTFTATATTNRGVSISDSLTVTVNAPPSVQLGSITGSPFIAPATLGLSANASDSDGSIARVEFFANGSHVGTDGTAPFQTSWSNVPAGTYSITARAYDNLDGTTLSAAQSVTVSPSRVIGNIDGVVLDAAGNASVRGWACSTGLNQSINVHVYLGGAAGSGTYAIAAAANQPSEAAVASACQSSGTAYRFSIPLSNALRDAHAGKGVFVHGISPVGQPNDLISSSGTFAVPALNRNATFLGQSVPTTLLPGQAFSASVQMRNDGAGVWYIGENYRLGSANPHNSTTWGPSRVNLASDVGKGGAATFSIAAKAPAAPGTYNFQWQMLQEGVTWFGQASTNVPVRVISGSISASPNPCPFPTGTSSCVAGISWTSTAADAEVWMTDGNNANAQLFATGQNGAKDAAGMTGSVRRFHLKAAGVTMATVDVTGVVNPPPVVQLTAPVNGSTATPPASLALRASASDADEIDYVRFYGDGVLINEDGDSPFEFDWTNVGSGTHTVYAVATDKRGGTASTPTVSVVVNALPTATLTAPASGNNGIAPATVALSANAADADDNVASVSFYANGALVRTVNAAPYAHTWSGVAAGNYNVHAVVTDTRGATASTPATAITIVTPVANPSSSTRHYIYDQHQRLCKVVEPETRATVMDYDAAGNLAWSAAGLELLSTVQSAEQCAGDRASADTLGRKVVRYYDDRNRLQHLRFPDGRGDQDRTYTPTGQPETITTSNDGPGQTFVVNTYGYNRRGLLIGESSGQPQSSSQPVGYSWGVGYDYDRNGHLATQSYPTDATVSYAPNALGQPTQVVAGYGVLATGVRYHPNGALKQFYYGNGLVHSMAQNTRQLPEHVVSSGGVLDYTYAFDANGNVGAIYDVARGAHYDRAMRYDGLDRLKTVTSPSFGGDGTHRYTYDKLDNLTSWKLPGVKDYAEYYYEPGTHRLISLRNSMGSATEGFGYDAQGNLENKGGQTYSFDFGNRLRTVRAMGGSYTEGYRYDGQGRRVWAWKPGAGNIVSMYGQSGQMLYDYSERTARGTEHIYLAGSLIATRELPAAGGSTVKYHHTDALGSPVAVTDEAGAVIEYRTYEPYGASIEGAKQGVGYTGHVMDAATGLTYMQQRYYDPAIGRFLSVDPVTADSTTGGNFNRYWYASDNPYKFSDPDGRLSRSCLGSLCEKYKSAGSQCELTCIGKKQSPRKREKQPITRENFHVRKGQMKVVVDRVAPIMKEKSFRNPNDAARYFSRVLQPAMTLFGMEVEALLETRLTGEYYLDAFAISQTMNSKGYGADVNAPSGGLPTIHGHGTTEGLRGAHAPFSSNDINWYGSSPAPFHFVTDSTGVYRFDMGTQVVVPLGE